MGDLTQARLRELLDYDPETGVFTWKVRRSSNALAGSAAGCVNKHLGYVYICIDTKRYLAHRLAFLWMTGSFPDEQTDHRNGVRHDNRWLNLRLATHQENAQNSRRSKEPLSGLTGVGWHKQREKWRAYIAAGTKYMHLGLFDTKEDAHAAYVTAKANLHPFQPTQRDK